MPLSFIYRLRTSKMPERPSERVGNSLRQAQSGDPGRLSPMQRSSDIGETGDLTLCVTMWLSSASACSCTVPQNRYQGKETRVPHDKSLEFSNTSGKHRIVRSFGCLQVTQMFCCLPNRDFSRNSTLIIFVRHNGGLQPQKPIIIILQAAGARSLSSFDIKR
jgi:hypothetical protein